MRQQKETNEPGLKIVINYPQIATYVGQFVGQIIKPKFCISEKSNINTFPK